MRLSDGGRASAGGFVRAVLGAREVDAATAHLPAGARAHMGGAFRSLLKIAEAESAGRVDTRWKLLDTRYDMRIFRKVRRGPVVGRSACVTTGAESAFWG